MRFLTTFSVILTRVFQNLGHTTTNSVFIYDENGVFDAEYCRCRIHCLHPLTEYCGCSCIHCTHVSYAYVAYRQSINPVTPTAVSHFLIAVPHVFRVQFRTVFVLGRAVNKAAVEPDISALIRYRIGTRRAPAAAAAGATMFGMMA